MPASARLSLALSAVVVLIIAVSSVRPGVHAQSAQQAAERYVNDVALAAQDLNGMRLERAATVSLPQTLAGRAQYFARTGTQTLTNLTVKVFVFTDAEQARRYHAGLPQAARDRFDVQFHTPNPLNCAVRTGIPVADEGTMCIYRQDDHGDGFVAWRSGQVYFELSTSIRPVLEVEILTGQHANLQGRKMENFGPFGAAQPTPPPGTPSPTVPPTATPTPAPPPPPAQRGPDMQVLAVARIGGALAADGVAVTALIDGRECGSGTVSNGLAMLMVLSAEARAGCGTPGASISFRIGDDAASETLAWNPQPLAGLVSLAAARAVVGGGLVVRPTLQGGCIATTADCSLDERALWSGDRAAWQSQLAERGEEATGESMLRAWMQFRAGRGEVFGNLALAMLESRPFTFILAVRHGSTAAEPEPYVSLFNLGAERQAGGWALRTGSGQAFTFPSDTVLGRGQCRIYVNPLDSPESGPACQTAAFPAPGVELPPRGGYVELVDEQGTVIDSVGW
jgi:hypothetical protein